MLRSPKALLINTRLGWAGALVAIVAGIAIEGIWGPLWGLYGWRVVASAIMIVVILIFLGIEELLRPPNPYGRLHPLYDKRDLGPTGELHSSDPSWLWQALPLVLGAVVLLLTLRWF